MIRFHDLDGLRAFAMLLGLVLHGLLSFLPMPVWPAQDINQQPEIYGAIVALIHGFRMPLFFLLSGFFMALLWQRRGASGLIKNRSLRILVPLIAGTVAVSPLLWGVGYWGVVKKAEISAKEKERAGAVLNPTATSDAATESSLARVTRHLDEGGDVNGRDEFGISLLTWACLRGNSKVVELLIDRGAKVNARDSAGRIPLHGAAFMGRAEIVDQLIEAGTEVNVIGSSNDTPLDSASSNEATLHRLAGMMNLEFDVYEVREGREKLKEALRKVGAKHSRELPTDYLALLRMVAFAPIFSHLWFLNYLLWFTLAFLIFAALAKAMKLRALPAFLIRAPLCLLWLIPLTWLAQRMMDIPLGPDTAAGLIPWPPIFFYYGIFVLYGALCFGQEAFLKSSRFGWIVYLLLAAVVGMAGISEIQWGEYHEVIQPLFGATFVWLMSFGLIGTFRRFFHAENRKIRWLSDSAYWLYIAHLPLMMGLQVWVSDWDFPSFAKFLFVLLSTTAILLVLYQFCIRYSFVGTVLNGKKVRQRDLAPGE